MTHLLTPMGSHNKKSMGSHKKNKHGVARTEKAAKQTGLTTPDQSRPDQSGVAGRRGSHKNKQVKGHTKKNRVARSLKLDFYGVTHTQKYGVLAGEMFQEVQQSNICRTSISI